MHATLGPGGRTTSMPQPRLQQQQPHRPHRHAAPVRLPFVSLTNPPGVSCAHALRDDAAVALPVSIQGRLALYAVSDLHCDYPENLAWTRHLAQCMGEQQKQQVQQGQPGGCVPTAATTTTTVCIVAGDVSDDLAVLRATFEALQEAFDLVAFVPGNHSLWVKDKHGATDSVAKLRAVLALCDECGVIRQPVQLGGLLLAPLLSWHHQSFDREADIPGVPRAGAMTIADYSACRWPPELPGASQHGSEALAAWFDSVNESELQQPGWGMLARALAGGSDGNGGSNGDSSSSSGSNGHTSPHLITFSHFLPHQHLLPEKRMLTYPNLAKAVGSDPLWRRLQQLQPQLHVFGHSHFAWDAVIDGIRFLQAPLCYPRERVTRLRSIVLLTQAEHEAQQQQQQQQQTQKQQQQQQQQTQQLQQHQHGGATSSTSSTSTSSATSSTTSSGSSSSHSLPPGPRQQRANMPAALRRQHSHMRHCSSSGSSSSSPGDPCCDAPWLPVKVYEATYQAQLVHPQQQQQQQQQRHPTAHESPATAAAAAPDLGATSSGRSSSSSSGRQWLLGHGLPVLHSSQLHDTSSSNRGSSSSGSDSGSGSSSSGSSQLHDTASSGGGPHYLITSYDATWCEPLHALWSEHYKANARQPHSTEMAPWVARRYRRSRARGQQQQGERQPQDALQKEPQSAGAAGAVQRQQ